MVIKRKKLILNTIGIFFIILGIVAAINTSVKVHPQEFLWFCYFSLIILGVGVLIRNSFIVSSQVNMLAIPAVIWIVDFAYVLFTKKSFFGITNYFFERGDILSKIITLQHFITVPLAIFCIFLIGYKRKDSWKLSFVYISLMFFISRLFASSTRNVNCVYKFCGNISFNPVLYPFAWFVILFLMVIATNLILNKFLIKKS
ncbi:MAG: hypothetical protein WC533_02525 [Candidatus Pacearchaeota archaeon]